MSAGPTPSPSIEALHQPSQAAHQNTGSAHLADAKALLAQKLAQQNNPPTASPTDNMMTPATAKISQMKKKHFTKGKPISGPRFGAALGAAAPAPAPQSEPQTLGEDEESSPLNDSSKPSSTS
ncbi:hypothetical protein FRC12_012017 [Ceratobasidium sp. 428]|nr:hypothetical protein FRC09_008446 [Ceratobasidium sp. 395]KAG8770388.1 hypothetical protein FRC12_004296 [Ceratobasidium sp. 428]KAG8790378.1 hypothetical protein FRC12_012017 [Ceratobasidium sp. 428]